MATHVLNRYENMIFHPYKFKEFPKYIPLQNKKFAIVEDEVQERELANLTLKDAEMMAADLAEVQRTRATGAALSDDKEALIEKAGDLGLVLHRNSSVQTIKDAITKAEAALDR